MNKALALNDAGTMVQHWYNELQNKYSDIRCDEFVVMPNHFHCVVVNTGVPHADPQGQQLGEHTGSPQQLGEHAGSPQQLGEHAGSPLHTVVQWFKTMTTNAYIRGVRGHAWPSFPGKLWQRNYWEHVVRNEEELYRIREYIRNNPAQWEEDCNYTKHPARQPEPWMV